MSGMNPEYYERISGVKRWSEVPGGQELILYEILANLFDLNSIYLPFFSSGTLFSYLRKRLMIMHVICGHVREPVVPEIPKYTDALYFGTPTIVNDRPLFWEGVSNEWTKEKEREFVRTICDRAYSFGYRRIISGLGSGDISPEERLQDMGGGKIVCYKDFGSFQDWVLRRDLL